MKKLLAAVLSLCLALSLCAIPAMAATADFTTLIEECLTTEVSTAITEDLDLKDTWGEAEITWESSNPSVIGNDGKVKRGVEDVTVTLTAKDAINPSITKELTFTVLSLFKKVWYNNNFYNPTRYNPTDNGLSFGYRKWVASGNQPYTQVVGNNPYEFVEKTSEAGTGQAGFFRFSDSNDQNELIKVAQHPVKANDYAILLTDADAANPRSFGFALPSFTNDELPKGNVKVSLRLSSDQSSIKWKFGFNGSLTGSSQHVNWRYNNATTGTSYITWNPSGASPSLMSDMPLTNGLNFATDGLVYLDSAVTFNVNTETSTLKLESASPAGNYTAYREYEHTNKVWGTNEDNKVLKSIYFNGIGGTSNLYVDDIVITTETTEIQAETPDEQLAIYKTLLSNKLDEAIENEAHVTDDIDLDVLDITGYDVTWASSDTSAIVIDGKTADVQLTEIIKDVTLTGTITHEGATPVTITRHLTVKPYGATTVSYWGNASNTPENKCIVTYEDAAVGTYASGQLNTMHKPDHEKTFQIVEEDGNKYAKSEEGGNLRYGSGGWTGRIGGSYKTVSLDMKIDKPAGLTEAGKIRSSLQIITQAGGPIPVSLYMVYNVDENGNAKAGKWYVSDGSHSNTDFRFIDDAKAETLPELGQWFNIQVVANKSAAAYDIYVNGVKLFDAAINYADNGAGGDDDIGVMYYLATYSTVDNTDCPAIVSWDDIEILSNNADVEKASADLMKASIDSVDETHTLTTTGAVNNTAIAWTATGDAAVNGTALVKSKDFGLGETTVTATATVAGKGTLSRVYNLYYGTEIKAVDAADGMLNSIKYVSDVDATGYIAYYNGDKALLRVAPVTLQAGRNTRVFEEVTLPEDYASLKVFAWNENLSPLSFAYAN